MGLELIFPKISKTQWDKPAIEADKGNFFLNFKNNFFLILSNFKILKSLSLISLKTIFVDVTISLKLPAYVLGSPKPKVP